jgi:hypothetical protein
MHVLRGAGWLGMVVGVVLLMAGVVAVTWSHPCAGPTAWVRWVFRLSFGLMMVGLVVLGACRWVQAGSRVGTEGGGSHRVVVAVGRPGSLVRGGGGR